MTFKYWLMLAAAACLLAMKMNKRWEAGISAGVKRALADDGHDDGLAGTGSRPYSGRRVPANVFSPALNPFSGLAGPIRGQGLRSPAATVTARPTSAGGN
jgi:hypothetical protein